TTNQWRRTNLPLWSLLQLLAHEFIQGKIAVARRTVKPMQLEMLGEFGQSHEALEGGLLHLFDVTESHVIGDESADLFRDVVRKSQAPANLLRHTRSDFRMLIKPNAVGRYAKCWRLADVM